MKRGRLCFSWGLPGAHIPEFRHEYNGATIIVPFHDVPVTDLVEPAPKRLTCYPWRKGGGGNPHPLSLTQGATLLSRLLVALRLHNGRFRRGPIYLHGRHGEELLDRAQIEGPWFFWEELIFYPYRRLRVIELLVV